MRTPISSLDIESCCDRHSQLKVASRRQNVEGLVDTGKELRERRERDLGLRLRRARPAALAMVMLAQRCAYVSSSSVLSPGSACAWLGHLAS